MGLRTDGLVASTLLSLGISAADIPVKPAMPFLPSLPVTVTVSKSQQDYYKSWRMDASCSRWNDAIVKGQDLKVLFARSPQEREFLIALEQMKVNQQNSYFPTKNIIGCVPEKVYSIPSASAGQSNQRPNSRQRTWQDIFK